eukprot:TRINITY_DN109769_c0_g1_i1.p1 TRINITY_DN109769_c0_g1~~TRINITY_DN109769_c0_g1_i1.p1  ORF type:complete len:429 (-),score=53.51 TRINITY_DN109769_c0_g1_i1:53-1339(-)
MSCCTSRQDANEQDECFFSLWGSGQSTSASSSGRKSYSAYEEAGNGSAAVAQSAAVVREHLENLPLGNHLNVYHIPPTSMGQVRPTSSTKMRLRAQHVPCNTCVPVPIESEHFKGRVLLMYRPLEGLDPSHPYYHHFATRKRNWELRLQGKFKIVPKGDLFVGAVLRDFDYDQPVAGSSILAMNTAMSLIKYQYRMHFSWGARQKAALKPNAELGTCVSDLTVFDQIVVTPSGRSYPPLGSDMDDLSEAYGLSLMRRDLGIQEYSKMMQEVMQGLNTEDTYTFRLWGLSQMLDVLNWQLKIGARIGLAHFMKEFPIHICMYDLGGANRDEPHLESKKRYFFDFMGWSNVVQCPSLPSRYAFEDAPDGLEASSYRGNRLQSSTSFHSVCSESAPKPFWARVKDRLRWIPGFACSTAAANERNALSCHEY